MGELKSNTLQKKIWFLWIQGKGDMPVVVSACYESWLKHNPDWEIVFLNLEEAIALTDLDSVIYNRQSKIPNVVISELVRINLLARHGGVWVDATCFCQKPLDDWLPDVMTEGFFAFDRPGEDRRISSWFLAGRPDNTIVKEYAEAANSFWVENKRIEWRNDKPILNGIIRKSKIDRFLRKNSHIWYHPFFVKFLKIRSYYWFHYLFEKLYQERPHIKLQWEKVPKISADIPHRIWNDGLFSPLKPAIKEAIDQKRDPLYKLTWKYESSQLEHSSNLSYLLFRDNPLSS